MFYYWVINKSDLQNQIWTDRAKVDEMEEVGAVGRQRLENYCLIAESLRKHFLYHIIIIIIYVFYNHHQSLSYIYSIIIIENKFNMVKWP